ncbi:hypothetical protein [Paenibacillus sp. BAC0078]
MKEVFTPEILKTIAGLEQRLALGDMEVWLETKIEYYVNRNKQL